MRNGEWGMEEEGEGGRRGEEGGGREGGRPPFPLPPSRSPPPLASRPRHSAHSPKTKEAPAAHSPQGRKHALALCLCIVHCAPVQLLSGRPTGPLRGGASPPKLGARSTCLSAHAVGRQRALKPRIANANVSAQCANGRRLCPLLPPSSLRLLHLPRPPSVSSSLLGPQPHIAYAYAYSQMLSPPPPPPPPSNGR